MVVSEGSTLQTLIWFGWTLGSFCLLVQFSGHEMTTARAVVTARRKPPRLAVKKNYCQSNDTIPS
jgi:hypothetical protein